MIRKLRDNSGYSLVEVLAAIVLLSIAIIPMVAMFDSALEATSTSGSYDEARALANANLEAIKAGETVAGSDCPKGGSDDNLGCDVDKEPVCVDVSSGEFEDPSNCDPDEDLSDMEKVTVTIEWDGGDSEYSTTGVIAR